MNCAFLDCEPLDLVSSNSTTNQAPHHLFPLAGGKSIQVILLCKPVVKFIYQQQNHKNHKNQRKIVEKWIEIIRSWLVYIQEGVVTTKKNIKAKLSHLYCFVHPIVALNKLFEISNETCKLIKNPLNVV